MIIVVGTMRIERSKTLDLVIDDDENVDDKTTTLQTFKKISQIS